MYILEESQLLEDLIQSPDVLKLYRLLKEGETSNERDTLIKLLSDEKSTTALGSILDQYKLNGSSKVSIEQREVFFTDLGVTKDDAAVLLLVVSATLTQLFVIDNFTGPNDEIYLKQLPDLYHEYAATFDYTSLTSDGNEIYHKTINPWLIKTAQICWICLDSLGVSRRLLELEFLVWKHRYLTIHLIILHEPSETIMKELRKIQEFIFDHYIINDMRENKTQLTRFNIVDLCCELVQSAVMRDSITSSRKIFDYASEYSNISIEHTGVLGKRTRFQHKDIPQLLIRVNKTKPETCISEIKDAEKLSSELSRLPKDIELDDDTLLPDISFVKEDENGEKPVTEQDLSAEAQLLMLTRLDYILKTEVMEESLKDEWTLAYVRSIIRSATIWTVKYKSLAIRSTVEKKQMRKMDRALLQLEELIKTAERSDGSTLRMASFYAVLPQSIWQMQKSLGDISFDLGLFKNALEIYTRIEYWEGIIKCHSALGEANKAESLIRKQLERQETPYLYCLLGDATDDISYYEKSWLISNGRFARAKKSIGTYYYVRKKYSEAIEEYEQALKASPSNVSILSLLAYSCLTLERYGRAAECYRNLTYQDDTNFLAWNNLSKAYIKLNQKERAWRTLREAIKCNYEEWKIWENFMLVSIEIGALDDVMLAWHRLIDIKNSHKDDKVLSALTFSLIRKSYGKIERDSRKLLNDGMKLVARISSTGVCSSRVWLCYFRMMARDYELLKSNNEEDRMQVEVDARVSKMTNALQRATPNTVILGPTWYATPDNVAKILDDYDELLDCYSLAFDLFGTRREFVSQWNYFKLSIANTLNILRRKGYERS